MGEPLLRGKISAEGVDVEFVHHRIPSKYTEIQLHISGCFLNVNHHEQRWLFVKKVVIGLKIIN